MVKLLIAIKSEDIGTILAKALTHYEVHVCHNGMDTLTSLESQKPQIFIVELSLPILSGLSVLQKTQYRPPTILALTNLITESVLQTAADVGVQDMILMPCMADHIIRHLDALMQKSPASED